MPYGYVYVLLFQSLIIETIFPHILTSRGHLPLLVLLYRAVVGLLERNEQVNGSRLSLYTYSHQGGNGRSRQKMTDNRAPLSILKFHPGTLIANFDNCIKKPGIYGNFMNPIELLDTLIIENGTNAVTVRFAAQFKWNQSEVNKKISEGLKIIVTERLDLYCR